MDDFSSSSYGCGFSDDHFSSMDNSCGFDYDSSFSVSSFNDYGDNSFAHEMTMAISGIEPYASKYGMLRSSSTSLFEDWPEIETGSSFSDTDDFFEGFSEDWNGEEVTEGNAYIFLFAFLFFLLITSMA